LNFLSTDSINAAIRKDAESFINLSEQIYNVNILTAAEHIRLLAADKPIVLIAGPSGSSKTTTAKRLCECLGAAGVPAFSISMDNYFHPKDAPVDTPKTPDGNIDFESPYRVDIPRFSADLGGFIAGERVVTPHFDFISQKRTDGIVIERPSGGVVIIEGIHALNPLMYERAKEHTFGIYASVKTRITAGAARTDNPGTPDTSTAGTNTPRLDNPGTARTDNPGTPDTSTAGKDTPRLDNPGLSLPPSMVRLMRRLSRDKRFRGRTPLEIWEMYKLVSVGEEQYIKPFRPLADLDLDTFIPYEAAVYKNILENDVRAISEKFPENSDLKTLSEVLERIDPLPETAVPEYSVVHEFI
jgi:uridine kinase